MKTATVDRTSFKHTLPRPSPSATDSADLQIRRILVPIDFSEPSGSALDYAQSLSRDFGAELDLVHVFEPHRPFVDSTALPLLLPDREIGPQMRRDLQKFASKQGVEAERKNIHALKGSPFEEICRLASDLKSDLIVISTRGNTGLKHLVLGSTAERVVRNSPCPVLVLRPPPKRAENDGAAPVIPPGFSKILVPVDFSKCSLDGLTYAKQLARHFRSRLVVLHVVHLQYYVSNDEYARYDFPMVMQHAERYAKEQMCELAESTSWNGIRFETTIEVGHAGQLVCDRALDRGIDLIVTSTHGRTGFTHVLLGSTAEYIVRHATCPVLVVPSHPRPIRPNGNSR